MRRLGRKRGVGIAGGWLGGGWVKVRVEARCNVEGLRCCVSERGVWQRCTFLAACFAASWAMAAAYGAPAVSQHLEEFNLSPC